MATPDAHKASLRDKAEHELREFAGLTIYLGVCFGAIVFLKDAILQAHSLALLPLGFAAIKAAVTAKFILIGRLLPMMRRRSGERLVVSVLRRSVALLVLLVALTMIEEVALAIIHSGSVAEGLANIGGGTAYQMAATVAVVLLILIPYVAFDAFDETLGEGTLRRLLFERPRSPPKADLTIRDRA
jgi:hypothetical protein